MKDGTLFVFSKFVVLRRSMQLSWSNFNVDAAHNARELT
jgi:hypothetical protein